MTEFNQAFKDLAAINSFYIKKLNEMHKGGALYTDANDAADEQQFYHDIVSIVHETMAQMFGILWSSCEGDIDSAENIFKTTISNIEAKIFKTYRDNGSFNNHMQIIKEKRHGDNLENNG